MVFQPVNEIERLLIAAATDPAARPAFYRGLIEHELFLITEGPTHRHEGRIVAGDNTSYQVRMIELDGKLQAPIFTSVERISAIVPREVNFIAMKGGAVLGMFRGKDLVLNPGAEYGKMFIAQEVDSILTGTIFSPQAKPDVGGKKILLGQPNDYPRHITNALQRFFARSREVRAAYLAHAFIPDIDKVPHTLIGVQVTGDWCRIVEDAGVVVREVAHPGEIVDFVHISPRATDTIGGYMQRQTKPFYVRKKWLGLF
jgi:hypothetical protein